MDKKDAARALRALCDRCPLREAPGPVLREDNSSDVMMIGPRPGEAEVIDERPMTGSAAHELFAAYSCAGWSRGSTSFCKAVACRDKDPERTKRKVKRARDAHKLAAKEARQAGVDVDPGPWPLTPQEACAPRLYAELRAAGATKALACGAGVPQLLVPELQRDVSIYTIRGGPIDRRQLTPVAQHGIVQVLPTLHPGAVQKQNKWRAAFFADVNRAARWFRGEPLQWTDPDTVYNPSPNGLRQWLQARQAAGETLLVWDVETMKEDERGHFDASHDVLRCVGFAAFVPGAPPTPHVAVPAVVVAFRDLNGNRMHTPDDHEALSAIVRDVLASPAWGKVGHNSGYYDRLVAEAQWGVVPSPSVDTILMHLAVEPELPHSLAYCGSVYTDAPSWKQDHTATEARTNHELWLYNARDCVATGLVAASLRDRVKERDLGTIVKLDAARQDAACRLHKAGMPISEKARHAHEVRLGAELRHWQAECQRILADGGVTRHDLADLARCYEPDEDEPDGATAADLVALGVDPSMFNPGSVRQVGRLLFGIWDLPFPLDMKPKALYTKTGARSTGDSIVATYMTDRRLDPWQREFCVALRKFRKRQKLLGTYIRPLRAHDDYRKNSAGEIRGGLVRNGRVYPDWNAQGTRVGRYSASNPNAQNMTSKIYDIIEAPEGRTLVYADQDQIHLRIIASIWGVQSLLEVFSKNLDPHGVYAENVFGDAYRNAAGYQGYGVKPKGKSPADAMRDIAKRLRYAGAYGAHPPTIHRVLLGAEDDDGNLLNPDLRLSQVYAMHEAWMEAEPEWQRAWRAAIADWQRLGAQYSPLFGRRVDYLDGNENDVINGPVLMAEGDIMSLVTVEYIRELEREYPSAVLINQCHDSLTTECDVADAPGVLALKERVMTRNILDWPVTFTAKGKTGKSWKLCS